MRIAVYVRVSSDDQNPELQHAEIAKFCAQRGWEIVESFAEKISGTTSDRAEFQKLLDGARSKRFDAVVVWKLDRFARSLVTLVETLDFLGRHDVAFVSVRDNLDFTTAVGRLMFHMLGAFAEFEAEIIKERVRAGLANARARGRQIGRPRSVDRAKVLELLKGGHSQRRIARELGISVGSVTNVIRGI